MPDYPSLSSTPRIRCSYCSHRIPASSVLCPNCQRNPRAFYWKRRHVLILLAALFVALIAAGYWFRTDLGKLVPTGLTLIPTATRAFTRTPITIVLIATRPPATQTRVAAPPPTLPNTAVPPPTDPPTMTVTASPTASDSETRLPPPTGTPSPVPTIIPVTAPKSVSPANGERIVGANKRVELQFQPAQPLGAFEWFRVQVDFLDRGGNAVSWCEFTKNSSQEFPHDFFDDSSPTVRSFLWHVSVVRSNQVKPATCDAPYDVLSPSSDPWTFYWY